MVAPQNEPLVFRFEKDLEDYLARLPTLVSLFGQDLLIIGRQIGGQIDLLAIDSTGVIYIIELKLNKAFPITIAQVLRYRRWIKRMNREKLIGVVAEGDLKVDLVEDFQRHFGHPLPETVNESQVLTIIAASFHQETAEAILELQDGGYSCTTFRYAVQPEAVSLVPCCRDDQDLEAGTHLETTQQRPTKKTDLAIGGGSSIYRVNIGEDVGRFWRTHAEYFTPFVTISYIYECYQQSVVREAAEGLPPRVRQWGDFARQIYRLAVDSGDWMRVYVLSELDMRAYETVMAPPSWRKRICDGHRKVAYLRNRSNGHPEL